MPGIVIISLQPGGSHETDIRPEHGLMASLTRSYPKPMRQQINAHPLYAAMILAGGRGSRMGGLDKGLATWRDRPLINAMLDCLQSQTIPPSSLWISANRNLDTYAKALGQHDRVITDAQPNFPGPLVGIGSVLEKIDEPLLMVVPCDTPKLPENLFESLHLALEQDTSLSAAYAMTSPEQAHPLCCLLRKSVLTDLISYLDQGQQRVLGWMQRIPAKAVTFQDNAAFTNVNDPHTLASLRSAP